MNTSPRLQVRHLSTTFHTDEGAVRSVADVSFDILPGRTTALVGESGSGKSVTSLTLMRLLPRTARTTVTGSALFVDRSGQTVDLLNLPERQMRGVRGNQIAMIFQEPMTSLNPVFTIGEQIAESVRLHKGSSHAEALARAKQMLDLVEIPAAGQRLQEYPHQLSGGMRQRVMIALAMACDPTLWIDPTFGASGDMLLGALVGLGADVDAIRSALGVLPVVGWSLAAESATRCGLTATRALVGAPDDGAHHRAWSEIDAMLAAAALPGRVRDGARATFRRLGEIEAAAHGVPIDEVHFHEVGAVDAIVDIVGVWLAVDALRVDRIVSGPVGLGHGTVRGAHGVLPLPAPATASLLAGAPVRALDTEMETCTPTGAALLATLGTWGPMPGGTLRATARGAGGRDPATHANVLTAHLIDDDASSGRVDAVLLETNLDDVTPEVLAHTIERLLAAGADDAWVVPIVMKKSRPAFELRVLTTVASAPSLRDLIARETGTLGIRETSVVKHVAERHVDTVEIDGLPVRIKVGPHGAKPEHDDLVAVAVVTGRSLRSLATQALALHVAPPG